MCHVTVTNNSEILTRQQLEESCETTNQSHDHTRERKARLDTVNDILMVHDAMDQLISCQYSVPNQEHTASFLAYILSQFTLILPTEGAGLVKSVAVLLNVLDLNLHTDQAADALMDTFIGVYRGRHNH